MPDFGEVTLAYGFKIGHMLPFEDFEDWKTLILDKLGYGNETNRIRKKAITDLGCEIDLHGTKQDVHYHVQIQESVFLAKDNTPEDLPLVLDSLEQFKREEEWDTKIRFFCHHLGIEYTQPVWMKLSFKDC